MSPVTLLLRLAACAVLFWILLLALYLGLPSPSADGGDISGYATSLLKSGKTLTVVYDYSDFYPNTYHLHDSFVIDYRVDFSRQTVELPNYRAVELLHSDQSDSFPRTSGPALITVKTSDGEGISASWFHTADAILLPWLVDRHMDELGVRLVWTKDKKIEIWPHIELDGADNDDNVHKAISDARTPSSSTEPLLVLGNVGFAEEGGDFRAILPSTKPVSVPSKTYHLRATIVMILVPSWLAVMKVFEIMVGLTLTIFNLLTLLAQCLAAYVVIVTVWWCIRGRPPLTEYVRTLVLAKAILHVFHPEQDIGQKIDPGAAAERRYIRGPADFFRSSAPLDDLLNSFESTRHLTRPIHSRKVKLEPVIQPAADDVEATAGQSSKDVEEPVVGEKI